MTDEEFNWARRLAYACLRVSRIDSLPVDLSLVAQTFRIKLLRDSQIHNLYSSESGASHKIKGKWVCVYDDDLPKPYQRFALAHEFGEALGRELITRGFRRGQFSEAQADVFAECLLAPACVLFPLNAHTADEIAFLCGMPRKVAHRRLERMKARPLEKAVCENFLPFIEQSNFL